MGVAQAYQMEFQPILLKDLMLTCDIPQGELALAAGVSRATINLCANRGYLPHTRPNFRADVEAYLNSPERSHVRMWLTSNNMRMQDIWLPMEGETKRNKNPSGVAQRTVITRTSAMVGLKISNNPDIHIMQREVTMITEDTKRHFKLFRNPFVADVERSADIFKSEEHRYIEAAMLDAAKHGGFLAVIGEVGSGKTTMRREVMEQLKKESNVQIIFPQIIDKQKVNAGSVCDAIIMDLSEERPKIRLEQKTRQVQKILMDRSRAGYQACLIIEEAHDLSTQTLKYLKRFYELEDGYKKLLGIILIGQTELKHMFNESQHVEMREVIRRVQVAEIRGLNGNTRDYLGHKFKRVGGKLEEIVTDEAIAALSRRLTVDDGRGKKPVSHAYPLLLNNYVAQAMNLACEMGEPLVTEEVINAL